MASGVNNLRLALVSAGLGLALLAGCGREGTPSPAGPTAALTESTVAAVTAEATVTLPASPTPAPASRQATAEATPASSDEPPAAVPSPTPAGQPATSISLSQVGSGFRQPTYLTHAGDERLFVVEQDGAIWRLENGGRSAQPFLDINGRVGSDALERGLLSMAFHPDFAQNGFFYVNYTDNSGDTVVSRFEAPDGSGGAADPNSEFLILAVGQPYPNHNGGQLQFGPDGLLYIGMGDGGSAGDPQNNGQDPTTLLGALLRLDVDAEGAYGIPAGNPFSGELGTRPEIWAIGLRNPWRFSFDGLTGDLYIADVGQNAWEEVNFVPAGAPGGANFGWSILEGSHCYGEDSCDPAGLELPVAEYSNPDGGCAISGGYVYRGRQHPTLTGNYFYGDYCSGLVWSLFRGPAGEWTVNLVAQTGLTVSSFGEGQDGEIYLLDHALGGVYQIGPAE
ncbi:MAG: PQQ-dependent sugar dehydrogenase [Candidatus Promineifilaceae bacterium]